MIHQAGEALFERRVGWTHQQSSSDKNQDASNLVLQQLNDQRAAVSGVSLDEEAANLMRYQQAYAASAQVISAISQMMQVVINMKNS